MKALTREGRLNEPFVLYAKGATIDWTDGPLPPDVIPLYSVGSDEEAEALAVITCKIVVKPEPHFEFLLLRSKPVHEQLSEYMDVIHTQLIEAERCTCPTKVRRRARYNLTPAVMQARHRAARFGPLVL